MFTVEFYFIKVLYNIYSLECLHAVTLYYIKVLYNIYSVMFTVYLCYIKVLYNIYSVMFTVYLCYIKVLYNVYSVMFTLYLFCLQLTYADLVIVFFCDEIENIFGFKADLEKYPKLAAHKIRVEANEGLADWLVKRPPLGDKTVIEMVSGFRRQQAAANAGL